MIKFIINDLLFLKKEKISGKITETYELLNQTWFIIKWNDGIQTCYDEKFVNRYCEKIQNG